MEAKSFEKYFEDHISSHLIAMEKTRAKLAMMGKRRLKLVNSVVTVLTAIGSVYAGFHFNSFWLFFGSALSVFIAMVLFQEQLISFLLRKDGLQSLKDEFKKFVVFPLVRFFDQEWSYDPKGKLPVQELLDSHLFDIKRNTKVEVDDVIKGKWSNHQLLIANVKTTSFTENDPARRRNTSGQSFNGLFVRLDKSEEMTAFIVPKAKTSSGLGGLSEMKFFRDPNMTLKEQKAHNLTALAQGGIISYTWNTGLTSYKSSLTEYKVNDQDSKEYYIYTDNEGTFNRLLNNGKLKVLISKSFDDKDAIDKLSKEGNFKLLDKGMLDRTIRSTITYAVHSNHIWVLIPALQEKFELSLDRPISKETVRQDFEDLQLALASLSPFMN